MTMISVAQLKSLGGIVGGGGIQAAIAGLTSGKPDGFLLAAEEVATVVGVFLPPAAAVAEGIDVLRKVLPILQALGVKPHNSGEGGVGADPAGGSGVTV